MKPFLYQKLIKSLLIDLAGSHYMEGDRFLSKRKVMTLWEVSEPTAKSGLAFLVEHDLIEPKARSAYVVRPDFRSKTLILLHLLQSEKLPPPKDWKSRIRNLVSTPGATAYRLGVFLDAPSLKGMNLPRMMDSAQNLVTLQCMQAFFQAAKAAECTVEWFFRDGNPSVDEASLKLIQKKKLHGIAFFRQHLHGPIDHILKRLAEWKVSAVTLFDTVEYPAVTAIKFNDFGMGYEAASRLLQLNHQKLCIVAPLGGRRIFDERVDGFYFAVEEARGAGRCVDVQSCRVPSSQEAPLYIEHLLRDKKTRPTAIFFSGFNLASGLKPVLDKLKLGVPRDLSVVGCGRDSTRDPSRPKADLFSLSFEDAGRIGLEQLLRRLRNEPVENIVMIGIDYRPHQATAPCR